MSIYVGEDVEDSLLVKAPGRYGYLQLSPPRFDGRVLYLADLTVRGRTAVDGVVIDNQDGPRRHGIIARRIRRDIRRPTWVWNVNSASPAVAYRQIGYTIGAEQLLRAGNEWMQWGVANNRFGTAPQMPTLSKGMEA